MKFYHSNDLEVLKGILVHQMQQNPPSLFETEAVLVQSQGMAHWLQLNLADGLGVAARIDYPLPSSFVWQVFNHLCPELPARSHFDKQLMAWKLVRLLPQLVNEPDCDAIAHYLADDERGLRRYQLAHTIADVFDQYLVYRPDWLLAWERGSNDAEGTDVRRHPWQPRVWRALVEDAGDLGQSLLHRARLLESLPELIRRHPERLTGLPKRLFVFGIAALPGSYWQVLEAISPVIEVHFFLLNPCRNFWGDIVDDRRRLRILGRQPEAAQYLDRGNPLLASWGRLGRDFLTLVHDSEQLQDIEVWVEADATAPTLLQQIQRDILDLYDRQQALFPQQAADHSGFRQILAATDDSVRLVSAHSPLREVQRLHDQLLHWFAADPGLKPRDVVVMVPDIDQYAPYIDAVFASAAVAGNKQSGQLRIPWAIADQSLVAENPVLDCFLGLLGLPENRLAVTTVQDWLDVAVVRARFGISEDDVPEILGWLQRARIRWGLDGQQRQQLGLPAFEQNSWRKGLRQLLLGLMVPDSAPGWMGDWPVPAVEGTRAALLGKLLDLVDSLEYWQQQLAQPMTAARWQTLILELVASFFADPEQCQGEPLALYQQTSVQRIRDLIDSWSEELQLAAANDEVLPAAVVRSWFSEQLGQQGGWQRFLAGPVNFCTLMPMRSIPFRVVCLLGMNDRDYPRQVPPVSFDLMAAGKSRRGDRSRREDDRYLFLEALCSAQSHLYISYCGRDARENNERQPSVLVSELRDYIADGWTLATLTEKPAASSRREFLQWLVEELPLQPFSPKAYEQQAQQRRIGGFQPVWAEVASAGAATAAPEPFWSQPLALPPELADHSRLRVIAWDDVKQALRSPAGFFVKRRLRANLQPWWQENPAEEPFSVDGLEGFRLKQDQLQQWLRAGSSHEAGWLQQFVRRQQALGNLPVRALGQVAAENLQRSLLPLQEQLQQWLQLPPQSGSLLHRVTLAGLGEFEVQGELQQLHGQALIRYRPGQLRIDHLLDAWLDLVLVAAVQSGRVQDLHYFGAGKEFMHRQLLAPSPELAAALIETCVRWYLQCWQQPLDLLPDVLAAALTAGDDLDKQLEAMAKTLDNEYCSIHEPSLQRCLPELQDALQQSAFAEAWIGRHRWLLDDLLAHLLVPEDSGAGTSDGQES